FASGVISDYLLTAQLGEMLLKIITILSTISISVDCILPEHEPKHAVSSQSYHRDDVPLSYKFSSVHVYTTPQPEQRPSSHQQNNLQYNKIQFAPLGQNSSQYEKLIAEQEDLHEREKTERQRQYLSELNAKHHLEPRLQVAADNLDVHAHNYRSHTPGHNVQVLQSNRAHDHNDLYHAHPQRLQNIQLVALSAFLAVSQAGLLAEPVHYSQAAAVSSQSIVRHDESHGHKLVAAPVAYHAAPAPIAYHAAPLVALCALVAVSQAGLLPQAHYSSAAAVSSQSIVRHDESHGHRLVAAPVAYHAAPDPIAYHSAPTPVTYHSAPAPVAYHSAPAPVTYHAAPAPIAYHVAPVTKVLSHPEEILVALCALVAVSQAGLLPQAHYSSAAAVSSQSIVRHDESHGHKLVAAPVTKVLSEPEDILVALCALVAVSQAGLLPQAHYSSAAAVSSQSIVRHDESHGHKLVAAPVAYHAAPAPIAYHSAPAPVTYHAAPAPIAYHAAPVTKVLSHPEEIIIWIRQLKVRKKYFFVAQTFGIIPDSLQTKPDKTNRTPRWLLEKHLF
ncbi:Cuticular protein RR-2 motif 98, partial [Operophtera brumata]